MWYRLEGADLAACRSRMLGVAAKAGEPVGEDEEDPVLVGSVSGGSNPSVEV